MAWWGQAVGIETRIWVFLSTTRAANLMKRKRKVSNCATAKLNRFGIAARRPHISQ